MSRIKPITLTGLLAVITLSASLSSPAVSAPASSQPPPATNTEDFYYDFDVYIALDITVYSLKYETKGGELLHENFDTLAEAEQFESALWNRGQVKSVEIVVYEGPGPWQYVSTFDKRADAEQLATAIEGLGFYASVERVYALPSLSQQSR